MSNPSLLLVHFVGLSLSIGSLLVLDLRLATFLTGRPVRHFDVVLVQRFAPAVKLGLVLLWTSGLGLLFENAANGAQILTGPKFQAKMIIVVILTVNGFLVETLCLPAIVRNEGRSLFTSFTRVARFQLITIAAISAVSWYFATSLAIANGMNVNFPADAATILQYYGLTLALAVVLGSIIVGRIPRRVAASGLRRASAPTTSNAEPRQAKKFQSYLRKRVRTAFFGVAASSLVINLLTLTTAIFMMQILDHVLIGRNRDALLYLAVIAVMAVAILCAFDITRRRILIWLGGWHQRSLSPLVYLMELEDTRMARPCSTDLLRQLGMLRAFLSSTSMVTIFDILWIPVQLIVLYALNPWLGFIGFSATVVLLCFVYVGDRFNARMLKDAEATSMMGLSTAEMAFRNIDVVHSMNMRPALVRVWREISEEAVTLNDQANNRTALIVAGAKFVELAIQVLMIGAGAWLVLDNQLTAGAMIVAALITARALTPIVQSAGTWERARAARQAWRRIRVLFDERGPDGQPVMLPRPSGHLTAESVTYVPPNVAEPVIRSLSIDARPGEVLTVTGPSGAGKSTLARLMLGLARPQGGTIRLDGSDISVIDRRQIGSHIGYLPQEVELFTGTVYGNIARMSDGSTCDVIEAAHLAGAHEMILRLPMGYDTIIGHDGCGLSCGERRRIALARAFYGHPALLVLDEPSSCLDIAGEQALEHALAAFRDIGATIVVFGNQPGLLTYADRIAILNGGRISMIGSRDQVMTQMDRPSSWRRGPAYMKIVR